MDLGMIGLGRMGAGMAVRLVNGGHRVLGFDPSRDARKGLSGHGVEFADSLAALVEQLEGRRTLWLMVPAGAPTEDTLMALVSLLGAGDTVVDGGNSNYQVTRRRAASFADRGIDFVDCGTSGGVWGRADGFSLMIGGDAQAVARLTPLFRTLAPAEDRGWGRVGSAGAGHFAKMIHNGIEYALMQAYAEGFSLLHHKTELGFDVHQVAEIWRNGSVVRSWLLDLTTKALANDAALTEIAPWVDDSGEGRWAVAEAIELGVSAPVITLALLQRLRSRDVESFSDRLVAALRKEFGGHPTKGA